MLCTRDTVGTNAAFHCKGGCGYASDIDRARVYTQEEAQAAWNSGRDIDQPVSADCVDTLAVYHVDCQLIPSSTNLVDGCTSYVGYLKGKYDGNDVYWITTLCPETNFSFAKQFAEPILTAENIVWLPFELVESKKRRTFPISQFSARSMVQAYGLKQPDWLKRQRRRKGSSGKTRWNCPCCGKISWQHNPYDYDGCLDWKCEEYRS
ncbi:hypothetical protein [Pectobacterium sp. 21LCBS03]|uniref:hypothetical protein n=1 Tax=Pectobacterium sp. 21LCBS03 TaxID=2935858 RepID=UPI00200E9D5B|nr:hypothetical protein [Pectobacterium sp. 21LCBS03]UPY97241.1 hypothetical protein MYB54_05880 [Pectobacterium sp. 21LCBS03]